MFHSPSSKVTLQKGFKEMTSPWATVSKPSSATPKDPSGLNRLLGEVLAGQGWELTVMGACDVPSP